MLRKLGMETLTESLQTGRIAFLPVEPGILACRHAREGHIVGAPGGRDGD
jgi:hypothetical protein